MFGQTTVIEDFDQYFYFCEYEDNPLGVQQSSFIDGTFSVSRTAPENCGGSSEGRGHLTNQSGSHRMYLSWQFTSPTDLSANSSLEYDVIDVFGPFEEFLFIQDSTGASDLLPMSTTIGHAVQDLADLTVDLTVDLTSITAIAIWHHPTDTSWYVLDNLVLVSDNGGTPQTAEELALEMLNLETTTFDFLDLDVALNSITATNIIAHRDGADGIYGTADDDLFDTIDELDAVYYVGPSALNTILTYAATWIHPDELTLMLVNDASVTFTILDIDAGLRSNAAQNIIDHRAGADGVYGTSDDDLFDTIDELDAVFYVGPVTLADLAAFAQTYYQ